MYDMKVLENIPIASLTTMRIGGPARYVIEIEKVEEITEAYNFARFYGMPTFILGGGANTLGHDEGFYGVILMNKMKGVQLNENKIRAMGGETWDDVVEFACQHNLTGIEALSKIPGTAGAAPVQNIGAYGQDISQVFESAEVYDTADGQVKVLTREDMGFAYRKSLLNTTARGRYFVIAVTLQLHSGQMQRPFYRSIEEYIDRNSTTDFSPISIRKIVSEIREDKLPDPATAPSAGSFFKNVYLDNKEAEKCEEKGMPVYRGKDGNKINTGWLIEKAGFSGKVLHGIRINEKAALVLINESAKSFADLVAARNEIINTVYDKFGFVIEQEPVEIG